MARNTEKAEPEINETEGLKESIDNALNAGMDSEEGTGERNKPTDEEVEEARKDYETKAEEWKNATFDLSPTANTGKDFITYLREFMDKRMLWTQNAWMGACKMDEELSVTESKFDASGDTPPQLGYQALEFAVYMLNNPAGIGLQSAKDFEGVAQQHVATLSHLTEQLEGARKQLEEVKFAQEKWGAYEQGFYYEREPTDDEMPEGSYYDEDLGKYVKPGEDEYDIHKFVELVKQGYGEETAKKVIEGMEEEGILEAGQVTV